MATAEYSGDHTSSIRREPIGVVGSIAPWNYPLQMAAWKVLAAIAAPVSTIPAWASVAATAVIVATPVAITRASVTTAVTAAAWAPVTASVRAASAT